jgi:VIT1/CCC1 family predicted Fe2+/Mn2+ transporter
VVYCCVLAAVLHWSIIVCYVGNAAAGRQEGKRVMTPASGATAPEQEQQDRTLFAEKDRIERLGRIRELVFGSLDGLLVPLGVVSGVAGGMGSSRAVLVAGLAEAFAGTLAIVGLIKGKLASLNLLVSAVEIVVVGGASAGGGYLLGTAILQLFGMQP